MHGRSSSACLDAALSCVGLEKAGVASLLEAAIPVPLRRQMGCSPMQVDGKSVPAYTALYIATVKDSSDTLDQVRRTFPALHRLSQQSWRLSDNAELAMSTDVMELVHALIMWLCCYPCVSDSHMHVQHDEVSLKRKAKKAFTSALTQHVPALLEPMATSHAEALRRSGVCERCTSCAGVAGSSAYTNLAFAALEQSSGA